MPETVSKALDGPLSSAEPTMVVSHLKKIKNVENPLLNADYAKNVTCPGQSPPWPPE